MHLIVLFLTHLCLLIHLCSALNFCCIIFHVLFVFLCFYAINKNTSYTVFNNNYFNAMGHDALIIQSTFYYSSTYTSLVPVTRSITIMNVYILCPFTVRYKYTSIHMKTHAKCNTVYTFEHTCKNEISVWLQKKYFQPTYPSGKMMTNEKLCNILTKRPKKNFGL